MIQRTAYFAAASRGTEGILGQELRELGLPVVEEFRGGVAFGLTLEHAYRACLWSRVSSRILFPLTSFKAEHAQALYEGVYAVDWTSHLNSRHTVAVDVAGGHSTIGSPRFMALKTKDALVDRIRADTGARPNVDKVNPDVRISVHVADTSVTVSVDVGGRGLHRRGIGRRFAEAPLKEHRAAAILRMAGWHTNFSTEPLLDPLCGSGTIPMEAAWMALDVAPGLQRDTVRAGGWRGHDYTLWNRLCTEARDRRAAAGHRQIRIAGSDVSASAIACARGNLQRAGLAGSVRLAVCDLRDVEPPWADAGIIVTNPPYGERMGEPEELGPLYELLGDVLRRRFLGWTAWVFCGNSILAKRIGLRAASRHVMYNGPIECRLLRIPIASSPAVAERPYWRKPSEESNAFRRKLRANALERDAWAREEGVTCYRLYDSDLPEYNLAVDLYDGAVRVEENAPPRRVPAQLAQRRVQDAMLVVAEVLRVDPADIVLRVRKRRAAGEQSNRRGDQRRPHLVWEDGLRYEVNLTDYLDTGLFLDDRILRRRIRSMAHGRDFLNLFAYTCTASVAAAAGRARSTTSVDLSNVYLAWGRRNFSLNGLGQQNHRFVRSDVVRWVQHAGPQRYGLILLAPPSFSRSKAMRHDFDVQRDYHTLLVHCAHLLAPGGEILFTTNLKVFELVEASILPLSAREITRETTPPDFARRPRIRAWSIRRSISPGEGVGGAQLFRAEARGRDFRSDAKSSGGFVPLSHP
ncbi:bifunctional 23S rRNA (guanine(2069)-N(7))-methyltransferase RlmK/23S rRNA (guanine(2445)-N(2))-methyltransferase RlmL [Candidatus Fermentibacteria bacterium]|nr:bifunctional 23S rRNA (guanine(2069)-N(7))-methyltransferase RlmK/23S rRNA (guanine(2445)-N(2))-methyltransferase RlmL [Candidatus Fermentibacteria bacterium]